MAVPDRVNIERSKPCEGSCRNTVGTEVSYIKESAGEVEIFGGIALSTTRATGLDYIRLLREHMSREEGKLFPIASVVLTKKEWQFIDAAVDAINDPLFDEMTADDYQRLYRLIAGKS